MKSPLLPSLLLAAMASTAAAADVTKAYQWRYVDVSLDPADQGATTTLQCMHPNLQAANAPIAAAIGAHPEIKTDCYFWKRVSPEKLVTAAGGRACEREATLFGQLVVDGSNLKLKSGSKSYYAKQRFNVIPECRGGDHFSVTKTADVSTSLAGGDTRTPALAAGGLHSHFLVFRYGRNNNPYQVVLVPRTPALPPEGTVPAYVIKTLQHDNGTRYSGLLEPFSGTVSLVKEPGAVNRTAKLTDGDKSHDVRACTINERCIETIPTGSSLYIAYSVAFAYLGRSTPASPVAPRRGPIADSVWEEKITPLINWSKVKGKAVATAPISLIAPAGPLTPAPNGMLSGDFWCYHPDLDGTKTLTQLIMRDNGPESLTCVDWNVIGDDATRTEAGKTYLTRLYKKKVEVSVNNGKLMLGKRPYLPIEADETPNRVLTGPRPGHVKVTARAAATPAPVVNHPGKTDNRNTLDWHLFGDGKVDVAGEPWKEKEADWLSFSEFGAYRTGCPKPEDTPGCRTATQAARAKISANMRTTGPGSGKTFKQLYDEAVSKRGDERATGLVTVLSLLVGEKYGSKNRVAEVALSDDELARLAAAPKGAVTTAKTGKALHDEYKAALAALRSEDHVGRWQLAKKYRPEVPPAAERPAPVVTQPPLSTAQLTPAELARLRQHAPDLAAAYEDAMKPGNEARRPEAIRRARQWLADHPTPEDFAKLDEAGMRRICAKMKEENAAPAASVPVGEQTAPSAMDELGMRQEELRTDNARTRVMDGAVPPAPPRTRYSWPADIVAKCAQLERVVQRPNDPPTTGVVTPPAPPNTNANLTGPTGLPTPDPKKDEKKDPLITWNPLLNAGKGAILGAIVGFTLGGPLGMLVGAAVFGGVAWGMTKVQQS